MEEGVDITEQVRQRGKVLSNLPSQELLGYVAALLELVVVNQVNSTNAIVDKMELNTFEVSGSVSIER